MPTLEELYAKRKDRVKPGLASTLDLSVRTIPAKTGNNRPLRPWQEDLPQYQHNTSEVDVATEVISKEQQPHIGDILSLIKRTSDRKTLERQEQTASDSQENWEQSGNKPETQTGTKREQTGNKAGTKREQEDVNILNEAKNWEQSGNKPETQAGTALGTKREQSGNKAGTQTGTHFSSVVGLQRELIFILFSICQTERSKITPPLTLEHLSHQVRASTDTIKVSLKRIEKKGLIKRVSFRSGRGGWSRYELPDHIYREVFHLETGNKAGTNWEQSGNKLGTQTGTQTGTSDSSSSGSSLKDSLNTTTTEPEKEKFTLAEEWQKVDTSYLDEFGIKGHGIVYQLARTGKLSPQIVQESIKYFAFDLRKNGKAQKIRGDLAAYFLAPLKRGEPYLPPSNYEDPSDEKMRLYIEAQEKQNKKRSELREKLKNSIFVDWKDKLSEEERQRITPSRKDWERDSAILSHFEEAVWPAMQEEMYKQIGEQIRQPCLTLNV